MLPHMKPERQCTAKSKRSGLRCKNPSKGSGRVCRLHGWVDPARIARGMKHGRYIHGKTTKDALAEDRRKTYELREIEDLGFVIGMLVGPRTRGRKPKKVK